MVETPEVPEPDGPMVGVRVVELAAWVAGPAAGAVLADWGAEVVKVEPVEGDPFRHMVKIGVEGTNPPFELDNRGKRAIGLDVHRPEGRAVVEELLGTADVFISNLRPGTLAALGFAPEEVRARHPRLVVATLTGFGEAGPDRDRPSYDMGGFWARAGVAAAHTVDGGEPPVLRGAAGDHMAAMSLVAGINAALLARERTGEGAHVSTSLLRNGVYFIGQDANVRARVGVTFPMGGGRRAAVNPVYNCYRTADGRWIWLLGLQPDRHWPLVAVAVGHPEWLEDERFETMEGRRDHAPELIARLDEIFAARTLEEWCAELDEVGVWFEPVAVIDETIEDPQLAAIGGVMEIPGPRGQGRIAAVAAPVDFDGGVPRGGRGSPDVGEHTEEVLRELGADDDRIGALRAVGVIA